MSIVAEVLNTATEAEMLSLPKKMTEISQNVVFLRTRVKELMEAKYLRLLKRNEKSDLVQRAVEVTENITSLQSRLDQQANTETATVAEELRALAESLSEARVMCDLTKKLLDIDKEFESAFADRNSQNFYSAAKHIEQIQFALSTNQSDLDFLQIYDALKLKSSHAYSHFSGEVLKMWKTDVSWIFCQLDSHRKTSALQVHAVKQRLETEIKTLNVFEVCEPEVYYFAQSLMNEVLVPIISNKAEVSTKTKSEYLVLSVSLTLNERPFPAEVLGGLTQVFEFLHQHMNVAIDDSRNFINELGDHLAKKFLSHLVTESLSDAIPSSRQELSMYEGLVLRVADFNALLKKIHFLPDSNDQLDKFCSNVEEQFLNKTIERYLSRAREISMTNLQDMAPMKAEAAESIESLQVFDTTSLRRESCIQLNELPTDFGQFPSCHVSKNVSSLMSLVREILNECVAGNHPIPNTPLKLFLTARDCINLYVELTPVIHVKLLEALPQQSALFHNNCFFIAHDLLTLNEPYRAKYSDQVMRVMGTFVDMVHYVRAQGLKVLEYQVSKQNDMILEIVSRSGLANLAEVDVPPMLEKSLRQCIHQLSFLESMWLTVLPMHVYNKIMGQLCNSFLEEVISNVCLTKDIKEATATHLVRVFGFVQESLPNLFEEPKEVHRHIKKWAKLTELIHVLNGSLVEIGDRWADGKGPLALEFSSEQVRQLIKALFQVSDRRAAILSRIK